ncbi:MAG TPA: hypothetical protein VNW94_00375 [Streptosporangiaceae bacterium]|nr:hypothetical protein [Streptosporangiaceae bacterium]
MRDHTGRPRLTALGVAAGYGLAASVFTTIVADEFLGMENTGALIRLACMLGTTAALVAGTGVVAGVRRVRRR